MSAEPSMTLEQAKTEVETKTAPRVTEQSIRDRIQAIDYLARGPLTICLITMVNGFVVIGKSAPASVENFDADVGRRYAYEDAFRQLWPLEGYLLRERLSTVMDRPDACMV